MYIKNKKKWRWLFNKLKQLLKNYSILFKKAEWTFKLFYNKWEYYLYNIKGGLKKDKVYCICYIKYYYLWNTKLNNSITYKK